MKYRVLLYCKDSPKNEILAFFIEHTGTYYMSKALMDENASINEYAAEFPSEERINAFKSHLMEHYEYERADKFIDLLDKWYNERTKDN